MQEDRPQERLIPKHGKPCTLQFFGCLHHGMGSASEVAGHGGKHLIDVVTDLIGLSGDLMPQIRRLLERVRLMAAEVILQARGYLLEARIGHQVQLGPQVHEVRDILDETVAKVALDLTTVVRVGTQSRGQPFRMVMHPMPGIARGALRSQAGPTIGGGLDQEMAAFGNRPE
jgi:hypothetical protein